jgi:hypothetical protein
MPPAPNTPLVSPRPLEEPDAIDIWMARWLRIPVTELVKRYGCDSRRLYEIWWGHKFPASRVKAETEFKSRYPGAVGHTTFGYRRIPRARYDDPRQRCLFE